MSESKLKTKAQRIGKMEGIGKLKSEAKSFGWEAILKLQWGGSSMRLLTTCRIDTCRIHGFSERWTHASFGVADCAFCFRAPLWCLDAPYRKHLVSLPFRRQCCRCDGSLSLFAFRRSSDDSLNRPNLFCQSLSSAQVALFRELSALTW